MSGTGIELFSNSPISRVPVLTENLGRVFTVQSTPSILCGMHPIDFNAGVVFGRSPCSYVCRALSIV